MLLKNISKWEKMQKREFQQNSEYFQEAVEEGNAKNYDFNEFSQDVYSSLYQITPEIGEVSSGTAWAKQALDSLEDIAEYKKLRQRTVNSSFESGLGAACLTKHLAQMLPTRELPNPDDVQNEIKAYEDFLKKFPNSPESKDLPNQIKKLKKDLKKAEEQWTVDNSAEGQQALRVQLRQAVQNTLGEIAEIEGLANPFGYGTEPGKDGFSNARAKQALAEKVKQYPKLREIAELAGRFRNEALHVQANKKHPGPTWAGSCPPR
jgi:predicted acetyltransferase